MCLLVLVIWNWMWKTACSSRGLYSLAVRCLEKTKCTGYFGMYFER